MTSVEHIFFPGCQWGEPLRGDELEVAWSGAVLQITGAIPAYQAKGLPCDLIHQYEKFPKQLVIGRQRTGMQSPDMGFANADNDEKLIAFVRKFGPVVAKRIEETLVVPGEGRAGSRSLGRLTAHQDMRELRKEQAIYKAAVSLVMMREATRYDYPSAQQNMKIIADNIKDWSRQWKRERLLGGTEPGWKLGDQSLANINALAVASPDPFLPGEFTARVFLCELLNSYPSTVFPNPFQRHSAIKFGIRPLLYAILRRQILQPRGVSICPNVECRNFFNVERSRQQFCSPECSRHHRQRVYWEKQGKDLRKKRTAQRKRAAKQPPNAISELS